MKNIDFLCGAPRIGTNLLTNLLDGHPDIYMHPIDTRVLLNWKYHKNRKSLERFFLRGYLNTEDSLFFTSETTRTDFDRFNSYFKRGFQIFTDRMHLTESGNKLIAEMVSKMKVIIAGLS